MQCRTEDDQLQECEDEFYRFVNGVPSKLGISKYTVDRVLSIVNCIQAREYNGVRVLSEIGKKQRVIFDMLRIPLPNQVLVDVPITSS